MPGAELTGLAVFTVGEARQGRTQLQMPKDFISFLDWSAEDLMDLVEDASTFRRRWRERSSSQALAAKSHHGEETWGRCPWYM